MKNNSSKESKKAVRDTVALVETPQSYKFKLVESTALPLGLNHKDSVQIEIKTIFRENEDPIILEPSLFMTGRIIKIGTGLGITMKKDALELHDVKEEDRLAIILTKLT